MPNACNQCHDDIGEEPQWAQTISCAGADQASAGGFFGPGPTPRLAAAAHADGLGGPACIEEQVETGAGSAGNRVYSA